jgi:hypothetical protein
MLFAEPSFCTEVFFFSSVVALTDVIEYVPKNVPRFSLVLAFDLTDVPRFSLVLPFDMTLSIRDR